MYPILDSFHVRMWYPRFDAVCRNVFVDLWRTVDIFHHFHINHSFLFRSEKLHKI